LENFKKIFLFIFSLIPLFSYCQREVNIWYFGKYAGIDFNSGVPIPLLDGALNQWEGVATFSDSLGNLLMYTDGESVWNKNHNTMPNGTGLLGGQSSTECAIIVPYPEHDSLYYLFTVDTLDENGYGHGLCYSLINMNSDNGNGDITSEKNIQLVTPVSEKITAIRHKNNTDIWVITHEWETDSFYVYLINENGLNTTAQIIETGARHGEIDGTMYNSVGYMRASVDGKKIASVLPESLIIEVFDFDNETGIISNPLTIPDYEMSGYGVEFSPDVSKLYITSYNSLFQIDLEAGSQQDILDSYTLIGSSIPDKRFGALQLATDGKIYMAHDTSEYLGVINNPSGSPGECDFNVDGFYLGGKLSYMGLPDFIQTYFTPPYFKNSLSCFGDSTEFFITDVLNIDSVLWNFGDFPSGIENSSKLLNPKHLYPDSGNYYVELKIYKLGVEYLKSQVIRVNSLPYLNLGNDTVFCSGDSINLNSYFQNCSYLWNNFSVDSFLTVKQAGEYWVNVTNNYINCSNSDTIEVNLYSLPNFSLGNDTSFCINDSLKIEMAYQNAVFLWNTNSTESAIFATETGQYWLQITDSLGCANTDTIVLSNYLLPEVYLGNDTVICPDTEIGLNVFRENATYLWNDSTTNSFINISLPGQYFVNLIDSLKCKNSDTINIVPEFNLEFELGNDTVLCENEVLTLSASLNEALFLWNDDTTDSIYIVRNEGFYRLKATNICGSATDSIYVDYVYCGEIYIPNIITPNGDNINDYFKIKGIDEESWILEIYNRWGTLIFESNNYQNDWNGENHSDGVYYYILYNQQYNLTYKGFVHVYN
jgi:gliding motility-associated-like protein